MPSHRARHFPGLEQLVPRTDALPENQRATWEQLTAIPLDFVLYGGTALALRLGHRRSLDFDLFASRRFAPGDLLREVPLLRSARPVRTAPDTLTVAFGDVLVSFFGVEIGAVSAPSLASDTAIPVASLPDLAATKTKALLDRAEQKDYLDLVAILDAGISLEECLGYASAVFGAAFEPMLALKAAASFEDGDLPGLPEQVKTRLRSAAAAVTAIPVIKRAQDAVLPPGLPVT